KLYDLPPLWRSKRYAVRGTGGKAEFWEKTAGEKLRAFDKKKPLVFSLDDIVLTNDALVPLALDEKDEAAIFFHGFSDKGAPKGNAISAQGVFEPGEDAKTKPYFPYSDVKIRDGNYLSEYADWTRLVLVQGGVFSVFEHRTKDAGDP